MLEKQTNKLLDEWQRMNLIPPWTRPPTNICHQYTFEAEDQNQAKSYGEIFTMRNKSNGKKKILISMLEAPMFTVIEKVFSIFSGC